MSSFTITISSDIYRALVAHARADYPREACGLLRGRHGVVTDFFPARNVAPEPRQNYQIDPLDLLNALEWEDAGDDLAAIYHSHPSSPPYPSAVDAANAFYPDSVYLILSLQNPDAPELRGFYLRPEAVLHGRSAAMLLREKPFLQVRPGLQGCHLSADVMLPGLSRRPAPQEVAFYLIFDENSGRQPPSVRLISVQSVTVIIQI